jgi:hypothetical protein
MSATAGAQEAADFVDILRVRFPRLTVPQAVQVLLAALGEPEVGGRLFSRYVDAEPCRCRCSDA